MFKTGVVVCVFYIYIYLFGMDTTNITNRRLVAETTNQLKTVVEKYPDVPEGGLVVKVLVCGICHSDSHFYAEETYKGYLPRVLGHEAAGIIDRISDQCTDKSLTVGDRVVIYSWGWCRKCSYCLAGSQYCQDRASPNMHVYGLTRDGGFQQYTAVADPFCVVKVPDVIPLERACLVPCSGITGYSGLLQSKDSIKTEIGISGQARILLMGVGGLGLWAIEFAKIKYGDKLLVCAADVFGEKLEQAKAAGADICVKTSKEDDVQTAASKIVSAAGGKMTAAIDFVNYPATMDTCLKSLATGGTLAVVGLQGTTFPPVNLQQVIFDNLRIQGIAVGHRHYVEEIFKLISDNKVKGPPITTVPFEEIGSILDKMVSRELINGRYVAKIA